MSLLFTVTPEAGKGDKAITSLLTPAQEEFRQNLRKRLIAARGSTYIYKDPDVVAGRAGGSIGDDGTINFGDTKVPVGTGDAPPTAAGGAGRIGRVNIRPR